MLRNYFEGLWIKSTKCYNPHFLAYLEIVCLATPIFFAISTFENPLTSISFIIATFVIDILIPEQYGQEHSFQTGQIR
jgi:hypothetical protein